MIGKRAMLGSLKFAAELADRVRVPVRGVTVLIYHRVGSRTASEVDLPADVFDRQIATLADARRVVTIDQATRLMRGLEQGPSDPVVVTFDDGTADFGDLAMPILERHRVPATLYLATEFVEHGRSFPGDARPLSWHALRDALSSGLLTVGSHTHTHALLDRVSAEAAEIELRTSIDLIQDRLGVTAEHFAYPKAVLASPEVEAVVRDNFRSAALGGGRANPPGRTDLHRISRTAIQVTDGMRWFKRKADGGMALEETIRRKLNRRRYELLRS